MGNVRSVKEVALADTKSMVCPPWLNMGIQRDMLAKTKMVMREVKRSILAVVEWQQWKYQKVTKSLIRY